MRRFTVGSGDIVVVVPRWLIAAVGLLMLLMGLSAAFILLFAGLITEAMLFALFVIVFVPIQLLIAYITWRFYWQLLILGMMLQALCYCTLMTGLTGFAGQLYPSVRGTPLAPVIMAIVQAHAANVILAFVLALVVVSILAGLLFMAFGSSTATPMAYDVDTLDRPVQKPVRRKNGPRDLWTDEE